MDDLHVYNSVACNGAVNMVVGIYVVGTVVVVCTCFEVVDLVVVNILANVIGTGMVTCVIVVVVGDVVGAKAGYGLDIVVVVKNNEPDGLIVVEVGLVVCVYVIGTDIVGSDFVIEVDIVLGIGVAMVDVVYGEVMLEVNLVACVSVVGVNVVNFIDEELGNSEPDIVKALLCKV